MEGSSSKQIASLFRRFDKNGDGTIERRELEQVLRVLNRHLYTDKEITKAMKVIDKNKDGLVSYEEFVEWIAGSEQGQEVSDLASATKGTERLADKANFTGIHAREGTDDSGAKDLSQMTRGGNMGSTHMKGGKVKESKADVLGGPGGQVDLADLTASKTGSTAMKPGGKTQAKGPEVLGGPGGQVDLADLTASKTGSTAMKPGGKTQDKVPELLGGPGGQVSAADLTASKTGSTAMR
eukprot:TRINITY_DN2804_c0_g1_i2.p1 TRINITY_DN2804_c0_g1~~TRINITY_DN2804_c0_g1_i2.p1  ORF type:complete len:238 (+),score=51.78 TRINITY_DN2804_c0_g1_i2:49-762(+)